MKTLGIVLGLLLCADVSAQSARFGSRMVSVGDPVARVRDVAGSPEKIVPAAEEVDGREHWVYKRKGRKIQLWLVAGKVVQLDDRRDEGA